MIEWQVMGYNGRVLQNFWELLQKSMQQRSSFKNETSVCWKIHKRQMGPKLFKQNHHKYLRPVFNPEREIWIHKSIGKSWISWPYVVSFQWVWCSGSIKA
ncbi:hypothetical protein NPIL_165991 [Nephila pilipes]|uniref:Uncharacterized protein n=1 Tax=Nephila pilipes TaxID=299642 RepID=A0A8X6QWP2_NEPPI|nr:hypothetical protein NPIL_165991 [Nephila pilipes]